jgi:hypothetical protein
MGKYSGQIAASSRQKTTKHQGLGTEDKSEEGCEMLQFSFCA